MNTWACTIVFPPKWRVKVTQCRRDGIQSQITAKDAVTLTNQHNKPSASDMQHTVFGHHCVLLRRRFGGDFHASALLDSVRGLKA